MTDRDQHDDLASEQARNAPGRGRRPDWQSGRDVPTPATNGGRPILWQWWLAAALVSLVIWGLLAAIVI